MPEPMSAERREVLLNKTGHGTISHGEIGELWDEIDRLTAENAQLRADIRVLDGTVTREWIGDEPGGVQR